MKLESIAQPSGIAYLSDAKSTSLMAAIDPGAPGRRDVLIRTELVGFCGTDREIVQGGIAVPPDGDGSLVLGHEAVGIVAEVGQDVVGLAAGDRVVPMVRLGCETCRPCLAGRSDYCLTGDYLEYGITRLHGFARPRVLVPEAATLKVPQGLGRVAVLAEPLSVIEKTLEQAAMVLGRIPGMLQEGREWGRGVRALVTGAGSIGVLTAYLLTQLGFDVEVMDLRSVDSLAATLVTAAGAAYVKADPDRTPGDSVAPLKKADLVVEATGDPVLAIELLGKVAPGGALMLVGVSGETKMLTIDAGATVLRAVLGHHAIMGTVNSSRANYVKALDDLVVLKERPRFTDIITEVLPPERFQEAIWPTGEAVKQVVSFDGDGL